MRILGCDRWIQAFPNLGGCLWSCQSDSAWPIQTTARCRQSFKFLERWSVEAFLYVGKILYIIVYYLLHWQMWPTLQSGCCIMYSYMFHIMKYYFYCICIILCKQHLYLSCERLSVVRLDDCNILQAEHLVENRLDQRSKPHISWLRMHE
jgi:hypothetical protein